MSEENVRRVSLQQEDASESQRVAEQLRRLQDKVPTLRFQGRVVHKSSCMAVSYKTSQGPNNTGHIGAAITHIQTQALKDHGVLF